MTRFLSLDKCLPRRQHIQIVNIECPPQPQYSNISENTTIEQQHIQSNRLVYDLEWLAILQKTHHWSSNTKVRNGDPDPSSIHITKLDIDNIRCRLEERQQLQQQRLSKNNSANLNVDSSSVEIGDNININNDPITVIPNNFSITFLPHGIP